TSLAPGSKVVTDYLEKTGLLTELDKLGCYLVGYGCTTCIGNSGPLPQEISKAISDGDLTVGAVISGNRNFEGRVHAEVKKNYADVFKGDERWNAIASPDGELYAWNKDSTYIKNPPYFDGMTMKLDKVEDIHGARCLGLFGD